MYETWIKSLIDILDELAPVTIVRSRLEMPLGSVTGELSTFIRSRLDLLDENSPWCDLDCEAAGDEVHIAFMIHVPSLNKRTDEEIVASVISIAGNPTISLLTPIGQIGQETYVIKGGIQVPLHHPTDNPNSATHDMAEMLVSLMKVGGFDHQDASDKEADDLVAWSEE
ncbi:hypothetical protein CIG75_07130 [Tumebacillus algifaecis]|uniref:Uncharacterized protein n=1 Tax=Tumebacillus algifaecis TaxID=1214604 RepID=A0A223CZI4_9BACL|nr:hypothetical protein [Tumebacillus algifaecis]ASS74770.1 hypothetical protein CIG75_07130 [Tumebacillus algifaecis]